MKLKSTISEILTNKWVLNIISLLALFNVIGYMVMGKLNNVIFFIVLALLVRNFSKNMIIVLGTPLIIVNLFAMKNGIMEGMENKSDTTTTTDTTTTPPTTTPPTTTPPTTTPPTTSATTTTDTTTGTKDKKDESGVVSAASVKKDSFEVGRSKNGGSKIDYASTIEDAYDDLNKILGSDGIKRLTDDTQGLMKQQMELAKSMEALTPLFKGMKPMIEQMKGMMNTMNK
jgi:cytoskeletal protein RodZ